MFRLRGDTFGVIQYQRVSKSDKQELNHSYMVSDEQDNYDIEYLNLEECSDQPDSHSHARAKILCNPEPELSSKGWRPLLLRYYMHHPLTLTCDSGATSSMIRHSLAVKLGMDIKPTSHNASQAYGKMKMKACGEI